jgi:hypothetical protein
MPNQTFTAAMLAFAIINGIFSPATIFVIALYWLWYPILLPPYLPVVAMMASLIVSTLTIMLAGVPAALYERFAGVGRTDTVSAWIWLAGTAVLSTPAVIRGLAVL